MPDTTDTFRLTVNGEPFEQAVASLGELVEALGYGDQRVATAVNGVFVAAPDRQACRLQDGDHVEVVAPRQGG